MASNANRTVVLVGDPIVTEQRLAGGAITPGHLAALTSTGTVVVHAGAALNAILCFALERAEIGKGMDDAYASGDNVKLGYFSGGQVVNALVAAAAPAIAIGDFLESAGNGTVRKQVTDAATDDTQRLACVGQAEEAVDNSGGGASVRIAMRLR